MFQQRGAASLPAGPVMAEEARTVPPAKTHRHHRAANPRLGSETPTAFAGCQGVQPAPDRPQSQAWVLGLRRVVKRAPEAPPAPDLAVAVLHEGCQPSTRGCWQSPGVQAQGSPQPAQRSPRTRHPASSVGSVGGAGAPGGWEQHSRLFRLLPLNSGSSGAPRCVVGLGAETRLWLVSLAQGSPGASPSSQQEPACWGGDCEATCLPPPCRASVSPPPGALEMLPVCPLPAFRAGYKRPASSLASPALCKESGENAPAARGLLRGS